jgi:hypothetical protein
LLLLNVLLLLVCFFEIGSCYVAQAALKLSYSYLSILSAGITGVYHHTWLKCSS